MEPADVDSILAAIAAVHRKMAPLLTDLTSADRKSLSKLPSAKTPLIPELLCPNETADIAINKAAQLP